MPSTDPSLALQKAFVAALKGHTLAGANVYDRVPSSDPFPRITLGPITVSWWPPATCMNGSECFADVDCWSREVGFPQVKQLADEVRTILHDAELLLDGHSLELLAFRDSILMRDPDGLTSRARMTFRALTQPV